MWYSVTASGAPMNGWIAGLLLLGCDEDVGSRITLTLEDDPPTWRVDLNPLTIAEGVDNTVTVDVEFEALDETLSRQMDWQGYRIQYGQGQDFSPFLVGELNLIQEEGSPAQLVLRAANDEQLAWVFDRYTGGELLLFFRIRLFGVLEETLGVEVEEQFTASFADYGTAGAPDTGN